MKVEDDIIEDGHDFLIVEHERVGFLINRDQFFASVYLEAIEPHSGSEICPDYCAGTMIFRNEKLMVYELDNKLRDLFNAAPQDGLKIALISNLSQFSGMAGEKFEKLIGHVEPDASRSLIAFRIGSQAEIRRVRFDEIKLIPGRLRKKLTDRGILGCRFVGAPDIYFFIDIETVSLGEESYAE